jgi:hypothetical protein
MNQATFLLILLALGMLAYAWRRGDDSHRRGTIQGWHTLKRTLPLLTIAFVIVGYVNVLSPQDQGPVGEVCSSAPVPACCFQVDLTSFSR